VLAAVLMMPLLGFYSAILAIVGGGLFAWIDLGIPPVTFVQRINEVVPITDSWQMLIKAPVFGLIIAMAGCFQGMQVEGDAEAVGLRTTAAVVRASSSSSCSTLLRRLLHFDRLAMTEADPVIRVRGLKNSFGSQIVHDGLDLEVRRGEILGVVGGSGTGKSVLMRRSSAFSSRMRARSRCWAR
jgi:ABC-type multidrug transport system fused ATPase/permease subunit